jgi:hypothetical protein
MGQGGRIASVSELAKHFLTGKFDLFLNIDKTNAS